MVLPQEEREMAGDRKLERRKEERVATIDLISRINCVQVGVYSSLSRLLLLPPKFSTMHEKNFSMQETSVKEEQPLHEDLPEHNGAAQREAKVRPRKIDLKNKTKFFRLR